MFKSLGKYAVAPMLFATALSLMVLLVLSGPAEAASSTAIDSVGLDSAPSSAPLAPQQVLPPLLPSRECGLLEVELPEGPFEIGESFDVVVTFGGCSVTWGAPEYQLMVEGLGSTEPLVQSFEGAVKSTTFTVIPKSPGVGTVTAGIIYDREFRRFDGTVIDGSASTKSLPARIEVLTSSLLAELDQAEQRWAAANPNGGTYELSYEIVCYCINRPMYVVTVEDGVVTSATAGTGQTVTDFGLRTVPQMFDQIRDAISTAHAVTAEFDPTTGVPERYWIDQVAMIADEEVEFQITSYIHGPLVPRDEQLQRAVAMNELVEALESYRDANRTFLVDGGGFRGWGQGWAFYESEGTDYPVATVRLLIEAGHLSADHAHDDLWTATDSIAGDMLVYQCKDRVGVFTREGTDSASPEDAQWWADNDCNDYPIDRLNATHFQLSKPSTDEAERQAAINQLVDALESYGAENGTYGVRGGGWDGNGNGWAIYASDAAGSRYPAATTQVLIDAGHLTASPLRDPLWTSTDSIAGDMLVYRCKDRVAVFTLEGEGAPSAFDDFWWDINDCNPYPTERLNADYFKLSEPL